MLHRQTHKLCVSLDTARSAQTSNDSNVCSNLLKFLTISTVLIMTLAISSALAYPASSHTNSLPHRSVIYFAPKEDSVVKEFLNEVLINNCQLDERDVVIMVIAESGYTVPTWLEEEFNLDAVTRIYKIPKGSHTAVLIGKDGKEKYRWSGKTDWQKITNIIDEMPMRQREMQRQSSRCSI
ncbi:DUF4174 domain-containing protein [Vibrio kanaloae]|uniref:DUF4174 domain-containing protein n=1 Tax=Vibrio kanaloae TaxID=170673 RepID=UPI0010BDD47E|nr:DUF4174 domain-containing protein [Vibrio kanaloae]TKF05546.1 DUF4174 domain-containing protein [Vibrio kanaloae]TKF59342.1 DUF4174 domain-containing protein [Vibrio kanaloae]